VSTLRARCPACRTLTAVAVDLGYECHSCGRAFDAGLVRVPRAWGVGGEAMVEAASLPLAYPEAAAVACDALEEQTAALAAALPARPLVLGGCCCAHIGAVEGLAARYDRLALVWLDAHGDLNTPQTSPSGNLWGMPLRMLVDGRAVLEEHVALIGARNLDPGEIEFLEASDLRRGPGAVEDAIAGADAVYIAFDADVLDPAEGAVWMPEPDGISLEQAASLLSRARALAPVAGLGFTGLAPDPANVPKLEALARAAGL
jgi:arginase